MPFRLLIVLLACACLAWTPAAVSAMRTVFEFKELPALPAFAGQTAQPGLAGAFAGESGGVVLLAGGANFPDKMPWRGGKKKIWDAVSVLEKVDGVPVWTFAPLTDEKLPRPLAYGASATTPQGVVCAGGADLERCYADVFLLEWDPGMETVAKKRLPPLPRPLAFMGAALTGDTLYLAGGLENLNPGRATKHFWALNLSEKTPQWRILPAWNGPERILPVLAAFDGKIYLFSGRVPAQADAPQTRILTDAHVYDPATQTWRRLTDVGGSSTDGGDGVSVMAGCAARVGDEILCFGGSRGTYFLELERLVCAQALAQAQGDAALAAQCAARRVEIQEKEHPGFSREILAYCPATDTWRLAGILPSGSPVTTPAVPYDGGVLIPNGEISPGVRTPKMLWIRALSEK